VRVASERLRRSTSNLVILLICASVGIYTMSTIGTHGSVTGGVMAPAPALPAKLSMIADVIYLGVLSDANDIEILKKRLAALEAWHTEAQARIEATEGALRSLLWTEVSHVDLSTAHALLDTKEVKKKTKDTRSN
jgi:hypothetical protein